MLLGLFERDGIEASSQPNTKGVSKDHLDPYTTDVDLQLDFFNELDKKETDVLGACIKLNISPTLGEKWARIFYRLKRGERSHNELSKRIDSLTELVEDLNDWVNGLHRFCDNCGGILAFKLICIRCDTEKISYTEA